MKITIFLDVKGELSQGATEDIDSVLKHAIKNGVFTINEFLEAEGHSLHVEIKDIHTTS